MKQFMHRHFVPFSLAILFVFVIVPFVESASLIVSSYERAIDWHGVEVALHTVKPGGTLELLYRATINKQCPSDIRGFLIADDGTVPVRFPVVTGGYVRPDDDELPIKVAIRIPPESDSGLAPLKPGRYVYRSLATRYCPDGVEDDNEIPDASFFLDIPTQK